MNTARSSFSRTRRYRPLWLPAPWGSRCMRTRRYRLASGFEAETRSDQLLFKRDRAISRRAAVLAAGQSMHPHTPAPPGPRLSPRRPIIPLRLHQRGEAWRWRRRPQRGARGRSSARTHRRQSCRARSMRHQTHCAGHGRLDRVDGRRGIGLAADGAGREPASGGGLGRCRPVVACSGSSLRRTTTRGATRALSSAVASCRRG